MAKIISWFLVLTLQIMLQISNIESKPETGAFGAGVLDASHYPHHSHNDSSHVLGSVPSIVPATTVERVETFSNGCYKLIIKEADITDIRRFIETDELICPHGISPSSIAILNELFQQPVQSTHLQSNGTHHYATPPHAPEFIAGNKTHANGTHITELPSHSIFEFHNSSIGGLRNFPAMTSNPSDSASPLWSEIPNTAQSEVLIISKKIGYYDHEKNSSAANNLNSLNCFAIFVTISVLRIFM